jgi:hypothetical protein
MRTSARPRTLVLDVSDVVIEVAMLGPQGQELGPRQLVPITTETATLWLAIEQLGEFDRITLVGTDPHGLGEKIARRSQRPLRSMSHGDVCWRHVISGHGVELALTIGPRFGSCLYYSGVEIPGPNLGMQLIRKDRRLREYLAPRVLERRGEERWLRRVTRAVDEILSVWNPTTLYIAVPPELPMPSLPSHIVVVPAPTSLGEALRVWNGPPAVEHHAAP